MTQRRSSKSGRKPVRARQPERISEVMSRLLARTGYAQVQTNWQCDEVWRDAVGPALAGHGRPNRLRRGVLEITVRNSTVLQEFSFRKREILAHFCDRLPDNTVEDIRFRVGEVD